MKVVVVGQGYVGLPVAVHSVGAGFDVFGYDTDARRVKRLNAGESIVDDVTDDDLRAAIDSVNNKVFEGKLEMVNEALLEGAGLAAPISATGIFPLPAVQMMLVGEETGDLDHQLEICAEYYSSELAYKLKKLMAMFEPAIIVFMGVIVGFVAVTMIQSIYGMLHGSAFGK